MKLQPIIESFLEAASDAGKTIDADTVKRGYISISPLTYEKTNYKVFELLK